MVKNDKKFGQYFTPEIITEFMCNLTTKSTNIKVLEPCAGEGAFLRTLWQKGFRNVKAYEIDSSLKTESPFEISFQDFLLVENKEKYSLIIGNPPYVRWKNIPKEIQEYLLKKKYWTEKVNSLTDLLYPFMFACIEKLDKKGELIFITPIFWTKTVHASSLRKYMSKYGELDTIIIFDEMKIFKDVSSSIIIFKYCKEKTNRNVKIVQLLRKEPISKSLLDKIDTLLSRLDAGAEYIEEDIFKAFIHPQFSDGNAWDIIPPKIRPLINKIEESCKKNPPKVIIKIKDIEKQIPLTKLFFKNDIENMNNSIKYFKKIKYNGNNYYYNPNIEKQTKLFTFDDGLNLERYISLGDIADIGNGLVSGLDKAFQIGDISKFDESESSMFINVVKAFSLKQYYIDESTPYIFVNDIEDEYKLKNSYPNIYHQLFENKKKLLERYNYNKNIPWWHWVFLRNWDLIRNSKEKILTPCKERIDSKKYARFAYAQGELYNLQDVTVIVPKKEIKENIKYILAILNSKFTFIWMQHKGFARGGVLEFSEKPLSIIPIRLINWNDQKEIEIHDKIVKIVEDIIQSKSIKLHLEEIEDLLSILYDLK